MTACSPVFWNFNNQAGVLAISYHEGRDELILEGDKAISLNAELSETDNHHIRRNILSRIIREETL